MNRIQPKQYLASAHRAVAYGETIEWEELPSFADSLSRRLVPRGSLVRTSPDTVPDFETSSVFASPWNTTMAAELDTLPPPSQPFREALDGLALREVNEPDVFRHFFGQHARGR